jgi:hypothetical protein
MWDSVDTALEQTLCCDMQYERTNLQVNDNEPNISNAFYYFMCLEINNAYKLQFFIHVKISTSRPSDDYCHLSVTKSNYVFCE